MDRAQIEKFVGKKYADEVQQLLEEDGQLPPGVRLKNPMITLILSIFLGPVGIDRLYQGGPKVFLCKIAPGPFHTGDLVAAGYRLQHTYDTGDQLQKNNSCVISSCFFL